MILRAVLLLLFGVTETFASGFDCTKASNQTERLICSDAKLIELDQQLTFAYRKAYSLVFDRKHLKSEQFVWLKERDACKTRECVRSKYEDRIEVLVKIGTAFSWLKDYAGKSTNLLVWDKRFGDFVKSISPNTQYNLGLSEQNLGGLLMDALGGPPDSVILAENRYLTFSACVPRFCPEKAWVWVDLQESIAIAAIVHYDSRKENFENSPALLVFSRQVDDVASLPRFRSDLGKWLAKKEAPRGLSGHFIDTDGNVRDLVLPRQRG